MSENKVVIKINYDKDKNRMPSVEPKMITVWHTRRILTAIAILILLVLSLVFWLGGEDARDAGDSEKTEYTEKQPVLKGDDGSVKPYTLTANVNEEKSPRSKQSDKTLNVKLRGAAAIIYTKKVIRASLNSGQKDSEPYQPVKLPIRLSANQKIELFYFTELKNIKDGVLYHAWSKDGRVVEKKQLSIKDSKGGILSSRTMSHKDTGVWQIQLVDGKGKVFSEVNFSVNAE